LKVPKSVLEKIEFNTVKGETLFYGVAIALRTSFFKYLIDAREACSNVRRLICSGDLIPRQPTTIRTPRIELWKGCREFLLPANRTALNHNMPKVGGY